MYRMYLRHCYRLPDDEFCNFRTTTDLNFRRQATRVVQRPPDVYCARVLRRYRLDSLPHFCIRSPLFCIVSQLPRNSRKDHDRIVRVVGHRTRRSHRRIQRGRRQKLAPRLRERPLVLAFPHTGIYRWGWCIVAEERIRRG